MTAFASRPGTATARAFFGPRDTVLDAVLRDALLEDRMPTIQVDDNAGRILQLLTMIHRPRVAIEIGTLFGYSTIHIARGLSEEGRLISFEIDPAAAASARRNLERAGVAEKVNLVCGDALAHLSCMAPGSADLVFIDAAKAAYPAYLKAAFPLLRSGGLLVADDVLGDGDYSAETEDESGDAQAERKGLAAYCSAVGASPRLFSALIGTQTGLMVSVKS